MPVNTIQETQVLDDVKLYKSKLSGMKDHLEALLKKKIRLDTEITILRRSIKNKEKNFALQVKGKVNLESQYDQPKVDIKDDQIIVSFPEDWDQETLRQLEELCQVSQEIDQLLKDFSEP